MELWTQKGMFDEKAQACSLSAHNLVFVLALMGNIKAYLKFHSYMNSDMT